MKTIVVGYDDTEPSKRALQRATELAKAFGSQLIVTSVAPVPTNLGRSAGGIDPTDPPEKHIQELHHARTFLEDQGVPADLAPAVGHPAEAIAQLAKERDADLVVVGGRDLSFFERLLGQSVSDSVAHRVHCDVLIVH